MKQFCKRFGFGAAAVISLLATVFALFPSKAAAAGETFTWNDYNTITVSGGDLKGSYQYKLIQGTNPHRFNAAPDLPEHKAGCDVGFTITMTDNTSGKISYPLPKIPTGDQARPTGAVYCNDMKRKEVCTGIWPLQNCHYEWDGPRFPGISEGYNRAITVNGTRPGSNQQTETEQEKEVTVIVNSPNPSSSSAATMTMVIKDATGKVVATAEPAKEPALGSDDPNSDRYVDPAYQPVRYVHTFKLEPGKYTVCGSIVITDCRSFTKEKFDPLLREYGDDSTERRLTVEVIATYIGGPQTMTVGPFEVDVRHPGGQIISQATNTQTHKMTNEEEQAQGGVTVEYELFTRAVFNGLDPATYEVCVVGVEECQDVIKKPGEEAKVTFRVDWLKYDADNTYERDCRDKYEVMGTRAITFVVCSAIDTGTYVVGVMDSVIANLLTVDTTDLFDDSNEDNVFHTAWNSFRAFALGLIVVAALVMVVSQAAGVEILDAYTVRKVLPRLLFASVFIALSWDILEFLVSLSNDAGNGIRGLIYAPFKDMAELGGTIGGGSLFVLTLIGTGAALAFGWLGLLSFVATGFLASLVAVTVLIVRKMIIILIILLSPFAIAASVLPNTRKLYETWKGTLIALLVVFPIIMAFIAIGRVFAVVSFHAPGSQTVNQLIAVFAYFAPYFLITTAFKLAGGVIATLGGLANDRTKGMFDRLSGYRANKVGENMSKMGQGQRFQGSNPLARTFNSATFGATAFAKAPNKASMLRPGKRGRMAWQNTLGQRRNLNAMAYAKSDAAAVAAHNDPMLRAQTYANAASALANMQNDFGMDEASVQSAVAQAKANGGFGRNQQINAVRRLFATGTGFDNLRQAAESIHRVAGKNDELSMALIGEGNAASMLPPESEGWTGRYDLGITFMGHVNLQQKLRENGQLTDADIDEGYVEAAKHNEAYNIVKGKPRASQNIMPALSRALDAARQTADDPNAAFNENGESLQALAKQESGRLAGIIEQIQSNATYTASPLVRGNVGEATDNTVNLRQDVQQEASMYELDRNLATGDLVRRRIQNPANPTDPNDTIPQLKTPDADTRHGYDEQRPMR